MERLENIHIYQTGTRLVARADISRGAKLAMLKREGEVYRAHDSYT